MIKLSTFVFKLPGFYPNGTIAVVRDVNEQGARYYLQQTLMNHGHVIPENMITLCTEIKDDQHGAYIHDGLAAIKPSN